jgi:uncharacterized protein (DUF362 family)/Pyruvate/2-oxoacid:ferredoxin oxidoreductase delta subunit
MKSKVAIRKIDQYQLEPIKAAVREFLDSAGTTRLDKAKTVLIKPNLLGGFAPDKAVTTHPIVIEAIIQVLLDKKKEVWIGDSPGGNGNITVIWKTCGISDLGEKYPVKLINFARHGVQEVISEGFSLQLSKVIWDADAIINVGKMKTHSMMAYTGAVKNLYGLIPGMVKTVYHREYPEARSFGRMLAALHKAVRHRVAYHILDGITGMDGAGPSAGRPRKFGLLMGSTSAAALDAVAVKFMGFPMGSVPYIRKALHDVGILPSQIEIPISFNQFRLHHVDLSSALLNSYLMRYIPPFFNLLLRRVFDFYPFITDTCKNCGICVNVCPEKTIRHDDGKNPVIMTERCIRCLCCHEMCPHHAIAIHKSWLARIIMPDKKVEEA